MLNATRRYALGENKWIEFQAISRRPCDVIVIPSATYELTRAGEVVQKGSCVIDGPKMGVLLRPSGVGKYLFKLTYAIADETRVEEVDVSVY